MGGRDIIKPNIYVTGGKKGGKKRPSGEESLHDWGGKTAIQDGTDGAAV